MSDFDIVCGVDQKHLPRLFETYKTWAKNKPSLLKNHQLIIFYDVKMSSVAIRWLHEYTYVRPPTFVAWEYPDHLIIPGESRFFSPQRQVMLAGFIHVPAEYVEAPYWLKLDLDSVAHGQDDWVDPEWFEGRPAIIGPPWGYTKPADQMDILDKWAEDFPRVFTSPPLQIPREPDAAVLKHQRISSWCCFFETAFTRFAYLIIKNNRPLPVPSQDGFHWYVARRLGLEIRRVRVKNLGWSNYGRETSLREGIQEALCSNV